MEQSEDEGFWALYKKLEAKHITIIFSLLILCITVIVCVVAMTEDAGAQELPEETTTTTIFVEEEAPWPVVECGEVNIPESFCFGDPVFGDPLVSFIESQNQPVPTIEAPINERTTTLARTGTATTVALVMGGIGLIIIGYGCVLRSKMR